MRTRDRPVRFGVPAYRASTSSPKVASDSRSPSLRRHFLNKLNQRTRNFSIIELITMSANTALEIYALKEKLLDILKNSNLRPVIIEIELNMYVFNAGSHLSKYKDKGPILIDKIKQLIGEKITDLMMYSVTEWAAAYVIAHERQKIEELAKIQQINITKCKYNYKLHNTISNMINELDELIYNFTKEIRENKNENIYYGMIETIEQASSIKEYLSGIIDKIEKDSKEMLNNAENAKQELYKIIHEILEKL